MTTEHHNDTYHVWRNEDITLEMVKRDATYYIVINGVDVLETWNVAHARHVHDQLCNVFSHQDLMEEEPQ